MTTLRDKASRSFIPTLVVIKIPKDVVATMIPGYKVCNLVWYLSRHEASFLGKNYDNEHIAMMIPLTL